MESNNNKSSSVYEPRSVAKTCRRPAAYFGEAGYLLFSQLDVVRRHAYFAEMVSSGIGLA